MLLETPEILIIVTLTAFLSGWVASRFASYLGSRLGPGEADPRDARIRSLEADVRVAQTAIDKARGQLEDKAKALKEAEAELQEKETALGRQTASVEQLRKDLRDSVRKTRELRAELTERASENLRSEIRLREVETELSIAQASTNMLASGILQYEEPEDEEATDNAPMSRSGS